MHAKGFPQLLMSDGGKPDSDTGAVWPTVHNVHGLP